MASRVVSEHQFDQPIIRKKSVSVRNDASMTSTVDTGEFGTFILDEPTAHGGGGMGPSPLQGVLGCLCGCEAVTFNRTAADFNFVYDGLEFEAAFTIDIRGRMGMRGVVPHFRLIKVQALVTTDESEARLREIVEETEARCPVFNLVKDANVRVEMIWIRRACSKVA
ncbi:MAG: OsmC family protein [Pseudomonadota bacterium]